MLWLICLCDFHLLQLRLLSPFGGRATEFGSVHEEFQIPVDTIKCTFHLLPSGHLYCMLWCYNSPLPTLGKTAMNTDLDGVNRVPADTAHTLSKSAQVCLSTTQVRIRVKFVVIPCTYTDFYGTTTDLCRLLQRANVVCTVCEYGLCWPCWNVYS